MTDTSLSNNYGLDMRCEITNPAKYKIHFYHLHNATYQLVSVSTIVIDKTYIESTFNVNVEWKDIELYVNGSGNVQLFDGFGLVMERYGSFYGLTGFHSVGSTNVLF